MKPYYLTNCGFVCGRSADYKALKILDAFEFHAEPPDGSGNLCAAVYFDPETKRAKMARSNVRTPDDSIGLYRALPSALLMYRLACLFPGHATTYGQEGYKVVWQFGLKHKATGEFVTFGEWKGGALFWTRFSRANEIPQEFKRDLLALLTLLVSDNCPHPYDGLVAGSVA